MPATFHATDSAALQNLGPWLTRLPENQIGQIHLPSGQTLVVMRPEQLGDLESIVSDPAFLAALESGVQDLERQHVSPANAARPAGQSSGLADAIERGVDDLLAGRLSERSPDAGLKRSAP